jgi:hypothetical protein
VQSSKFKRKKKILFFSTIVALKKLEYTTILKLQANVVACKRACSSPFGYHKALDKKIAAISNLLLFCISL